MRVQYLTSASETASEISMLPEDAFCHVYTVVHFLTAHLDGKHGYAINVKKN